MANKVMTAPLAVIKVNNVVVGKMKNIRVSETIRRGRVTGLGQLAADELPALEWTGSLSCSFYCVDFSISVMAAAMVRKVASIEEWANTVLLQENGIQIDIMRKVKDTIDPATGIITPKLETFASVAGCVLSKEGFDISESQISGRDAEFEYTTPILFIP